MTGQTTTLANARVVTAGGVLERGWVTLAGDRIAAVGSGTPPAGGAADLGGSWLLPGFVDLHMHGGGGFDVTTSVDAMAGAVAFHRAHGTTRTLVSLAAAPPDELARQLRSASELTADGLIVGAHLEGPFLSATRCGAQNPAYLLPPDRALFARLAEAACGALRCVTIAPELPGAVELIADIVESGAIAAVGHTDATYAETQDAFAAGATLVTHLFNGMRPMHHREPGSAGAALTAELACEVINDGIHVHPAMTALVARTPERLVLVTDAIAAAGAENGTYRLGGQPVEVRGPEARLVSNGALAGSTLTMDAAFRRAVTASKLTVPAASAAAATNAGRLLNIDAGELAVGHRADLVALDVEFRVTRVIAGGARVA